MISIFNQYPTYQVFLAFIISMALTMIVMPFFIKLLKVRQIGQQVRADGPQGHLVKQGTPTMGGIVILLMMTASIFLVGTPTHAFCSFWRQRCLRVSSALSTTSRRSPRNARWACCPIRR